MNDWERPFAIKTLGSTENFTSTQHFCWQAARYGTYPSILKLSGSSFWGKNTEAEKQYSFLGAVPLKCKSATRQEAGIIANATCRKSCRRAAVLQFPVQTF